MQTRTIFGVVAVLWIASALGATTQAQGRPIGFEETFALAHDRDRALAELIPGSTEHYYYACLHAQNEGRLGDADELLAAWRAQYGRTREFERMELRQMLLRSDDRSAEALEYLRRELNLDFSHQREAGGTSPNLPTALDPRLVDAAAFLERALRYGNSAVDRIEDRGLHRLAGLGLSDAQLRDLLERVDRPDHPDLVELVLRDLSDRRSRGFGSRPIHARLLLDQLEECARRRPQLLSDSSFVSTWLAKLAPGADEDPSVPIVHHRHLVRLEEFTARLAPAFDGLRAHVLYHRLAHDLAQGQADLDCFLGYLRLPRATNYGDPDWLRGKSGIDLGSSWNTGLRPVGTDEELVRAYVAHFLLAGTPAERFVGPLRRDWVERLEAETMILAGVGDQERWYAQLDDPAAFERLRDRVDLEFPVTQSSDFEVGESVRLELDVKNVETLIVKVFEIDTVGFFESQAGTLRPVDASIDLDGLVASRELRFEYDEPAVRRVRRAFEFPELSGEGVWVVDFIGGGLSSRAVVRKGRLDALERPGAAGHAFRIVDGAGRPAEDAVLRYAGRRYAPDERGVITVPYSTEPGRRQIVLERGGFATLDTFEHRAESYSLDAGLHVERERVLAGETASVLVRPRLTVNGTRASLELLDGVTLELVSIDLDGTRTEESIPVELVRDLETVHEFRVPERTVQLEARLRGTVESLSQGEPVALESRTAAFPVNGIDAGPLLASALLSRTRAGYALDVRGKNGEPIIDLPLDLDVKHRDFRSGHDLRLKTDGDGRVRLGELPGIERLSVRGPSLSAASWALEDVLRSGDRSALTGLSGETLRVAIDGAAGREVSEVASLYELRGDAPVRDRSGALSLVDGFLELRGLEPGDYELRLHDRAERRSVRVTRGERRAGWALGRRRWLELSDTTPFQLLDARVEGEELVVRLANAGPDTRVHVSVTRYLPGFDPHASLALDAARPLRAKVPLWRHSQLSSGRRISDEYRYVLERRLARTFPGNMLERAGLLLNPWAIDEATDAQFGTGGGKGQAHGGPHLMEQGGQRFRADGAGTPVQFSSPNAWANLDFLPTAAPTLWNLVPDEQGQVRLPLEALGTHHVVRVVAVDRDTTTARTVVRPETTLVPRDRRLLAGLEPERSVTERRRIEFLRAGEAVELGDLAFTGLRTLDSLRSVFELLTTLSGNGELETFEFLVDWPTLSGDEKRAKYSEHAGHEVNAFLQQKDPAFFEAVVRPYLENKHRKTFLDEWLLGRDLTRWLEPWRFDDLNVVERVLLLRSVGRDPERPVRELVELLPPDAFDLDALFATVLASGSLDSSDALANQLGEAKKEARMKAARQQAGDTANFLGEGAPSAAAPVEELEALGYAGRTEADELLDADRRAGVRAFFRDLDDTQELAERNYWRVRAHDMTAALVTPSPFWLDFAATPADAPFVSVNFPTATRNTTEALLALAFLDLPFEAAEHELETSDGTARLTAGSRLYLARKEIAEAQREDDSPTVLVGQDVFRLDEPVVVERGVVRDRFVTGEFLRRTAYVCRVVVTNPGSAPIDVDVLLQVPEGALPVRGGFETSGRTLTLGGYQSQAIEYAFYFPEAGSFEHYPVHVGSRGTLLGSAAPRTFRVVEALTEVDTGSWAWVSQRADLETVLGFLAEANLRSIDLTKIAWRMRDRGAFDRVVALLRERMVFHPVLWAYGVFHADEPAVRELLATSDHLARECGPAFRSPLFDVVPEEYRLYEHLEYDPLVHGRAHRFGDRREILDESLAAQYAAFLRVVAHLPELDDARALEATYYLALQDRVAEALERFADVDRGAIEARLQYDYMSAYLALYEGELEAARRVATTHAGHPVDRWRTRFENVLAHLDEAAGLAQSGDDPTQGGLAASEPALELEVEAGTVRLDHANLAACAVSYRKMDIELLFSTSPFLQAGSGSFAYVRPNRTDTIALRGDEGVHELELPEEFRSSNVLVEVRAGGIVRRQAYYANDLSVQSIENYGQLRVREARSGRLLPGAYVKAYAQLADGSTRFHKDGYTDLRGRFDYVSRSGMDGAEVTRYSVLVLSEDRGALVREFAPPAR